MSSQLLVGVTGGLVALTVSLSTVLTLVPAQQRLRSTADLAALGAARTQVDRSEFVPCSIAEMIAKANDATLESCTCQVRECVVAVRATTIGIELSDRARAGAD